MGSFSFICHCGKSIRRGEKCILIHKRNGVEIGRVCGTYADFGEVEYDDVFSGPVTLPDGSLNPNSHREICISSFDLPTSGSVSDDRRYYEGEIFTQHRFYMLIRERMLEKAGYGPSDEDVPLDKITEACDRANVFVDEIWPTLQMAEEAPSSGIVAAHEKCYDKLTEKEAARLPISDGDPDQGWGTPRAEFM